MLPHDSGSQREKTETSADPQREPTQTDKGPPKVGAISVGRTQSEQQTTEGVVANRAGQVLLAHTLLKSGTSFGSRVLFTPQEQDPSFVHPGAALACSLDSYAHVPPPPFIYQITFRGVRT